MTLTVENGSFSYTRFGAPVLHGIRFSAGPGDVVAVLGPNGAGKTTLLRCVMGFLRWSGGQSRLDGKDVRKIPPRHFWRHVAYVPQAKNAVPSCTAEQMVLLGRSSRISALAQPRRADFESVSAVMERLHLTGLACKKCPELSGGELQMVLIARALAAQPEILILDEPESNLDFRNQLLVLETISSLAAEGMACIFNTHYPSHALQRATRALLLGGPEGAVFGDARAVVTERGIGRAFGVKAVIGEIETPGSMLQNVVPLSILDHVSAGEAPSGPGSPAEKKLAVVSVITGGRDQAEKINKLLHEYGLSIVGRMGMPYRARGAFIINVTLDAPKEEIGCLTHRLGLLPGVSVKATYAPETCAEDGKNGGPPEKTKAEE